MENQIYKRAYRQLSEKEFAALQALQALVVAGGWLPLALFMHHFGEIRTYRPHRKTFYPRHPWRYPASAAERLFQLGYIHIRDKEMVGIVDEVKQMLPVPPQAFPIPNVVGIPNGVSAEG